MTQGYFGDGTVETKPQTYDELLANDRLDYGERARLRGEATISLAAHLLIGRGQDKIIGLLLDVERIEVDPSEERYDDDDLWLEVAPEHMSGFTEDAVEKIRNACNDVERRKAYRISFAGVREVLPDVGPGWQDNLRQLLGGKPTNHDRKTRHEPPRWNDDGLSFTNDGELSVYQALKKLQATFPSDETIGIFPLPAGKLPGRTWEPDALVTYKKRAGVLEIDGPHHNGRRANDMSRDSLWIDAGVAHTHRIPVEVLNDPRGLEATLRKFLRRLAETRLAPVGLMTQPDITHPFVNFLYAFGAAQKLLERAQERGSLIEGIVVYVSLIDGLLRMCLVLDKQLVGDPMGDIDDYIQQVTGGPKFTEKRIYTEARQRNLIDDDLRDEIIDLYDKRNAVIHRFFLEAITYTSLASLLDRYQVVYQRCYHLLNDLEERQIARGGPDMTRVSYDDPGVVRDETRGLVKMKLGFDPGF